MLANSIHPGLPTHASAYAPAWGSAWANWLAYNMGMARLLWFVKSLTVLSMYSKLIFTIVNVNSHIHKL